jgi:hypothetical protein
MGALDLCQLSSHRPTHFCEFSVASNPRSDGCSCSIEAAFERAFKRAGQTAHSEGSSQAMAFTPLIIRWGPDASRDILRRSARCAKCGAKGARLQHPRWIGVDVGWERSLRIEIPLAARTLGVGT